MRHQAIYTVHTNVVSINGDTNATDANGESVVLDELAITAESTRLQDAHDRLAYSRSRKKAYNALNQFELMTDDAANSTTTHADAIAAIKAEFPKP